MALAQWSRGMTRPLMSVGIMLGSLAGMVAEGQTVTIPWPSVSFQGTVEIHGDVADEQCVGMYTVPAGVKLRLTTFLLDSRGSNTSLPFQYLCSGTSSCQNPRSDFMTAPASSTLVVPLTSGIMFNSGETVYVCNASGTNRTSSWTFYGFLYK